MRKAAIDESVDEARSPQPKASKMRPKEELIVTGTDALTEEPPVVPSVERPSAVERQSLVTQKSMLFGERTGAEITAGNDDANTT